MEGALNNYDYRSITLQLIKK